MVNPGIKQHQMCLDVLSQSEEERLQYHLYIELHNGEIIWIDKIKWVKSNEQIGEIQFYGIYNVAHVFTVIGMGFTTPNFQFLRKTPYPSGVPVAPGDELRVTYSLRL